MYSNLTVNAIPMKTNAGITIHSPWMKKKNYYYYYLLVFFYCHLHEFINLYIFLFNEK